MIVLFSIGRREPDERDNVKNLLDAVIDEGKFYFESVLFDIAKKIGRNVGTCGIMEMGVDVRDGDKEKAIGIFYNLVPRFLGFWSVLSCNNEMELLFEIKIIYS